MHDVKGKKAIETKLDLHVHKKVHKLLRWKPSYAGKIKINVDEAYNEASSVAGISVIARDETCKVVLSSWQVLNNGVDAEEIGALACLEGLSLATEWIRRQWCWSSVASDLSRCCRSLLTKGTTTST